jgi:hypothetical protein
MLRESPELDSLRQREDFRQMLRSAVGGSP